MKEDIVTMKDIRQSLFNAYLDTEYREAMDRAVMGLGYVEELPLNIYLCRNSKRKSKA